MGASGDKKPAADASGDKKPAADASGETKHAASGLTDAQKETLCTEYNKIAVDAATVTKLNACTDAKLKAALAEAKNCPKKDGSSTTPKAKEKELSATCTLTSVTAMT